jgi:hypothetical protein
LFCASEDTMSFTVSLVGGDAFLLLHFPVDGYYIDH